MLLIVDNGGMLYNISEVVSAFNHVWDQGDAQATAEIEILMQTMLEKRR